LFLLAIVVASSCGPTSGLGDDGGKGGATGASTSTNATGTGGGIASAGNGGGGGGDAAGASTSTSATGNGGGGASAGNGGGGAAMCAPALPNPFVFFADPPVVYEAINTRATMHVANINGGKVNAVYGRPNGSSDPFTNFSFVFDISNPGQVPIDIPKGLKLGAWDLYIIDGLDCEGSLQKAFTLTNTLTMALVGIDLPFGWKNVRNDVSLAATNPPPSGKVAFQNVPGVYLMPTFDPKLFATTLHGVNFVHAGQITAVVPANMAVGIYDVIVVNPDGAVGVLIGGYTVVDLQPPSITDISPGSLWNIADEDLTIFGAGFDAAAKVTMQCNDPASVTTKHNLTNVSVTATKIVATVPTKSDNIAASSVCVVRVTNPDTSYGEYSALGVTNAAENISAYLAQSAMTHARRAPAVAQGRVTGALNQIYAFGGDNGTVSGADITGETAGLDKFGVPGAWRVLPVNLPKKLTFADAVNIRQFIYVVGGNDGGGADNALTDTYRAQILDPLAVPEITQVVIIPVNVPGGIGPGLWYYRVAGVVVDTDDFNPGGEELPSNPQARIVPATLSPKVAEITMKWTARPNVKAYRIYRTPMPGMSGGQTELIGTVTGSPPGTTFTDTGLATDPTQTPRQHGDLGNWKQLGSLASSRQGLQLCRVQNQLNPLSSSGFAETWHLYALGGKNAAGIPLKTTELMTIGVKNDQTQTIAPTWSFTSADYFTARWVHGCTVVDDKVTTRVAANEAYLYVINGASGGALAPSGVLGDAQAARICMSTAQAGCGGTVGNFSASGWSVVKKPPASFGQGNEAGANQVFIFGGAAGAESAKSYSGQICGPGVGCPTPPDILNWNNSGGGDMTSPRIFVGTTVASAKFWLIGGQSSGVATSGVESTTW
jgi:hypothetical protein